MTKRTINRPGMANIADREPRSELSAVTVVLPLRLFLGLSFIAASIDKMSDPEFLNPTAAGYIGNQLTGFATSSPLSGFLTTVAVPHAQLFGILTLLGELAIGLGTLVGLFSRFAAVCGLLLNLLFWLTISWQVQPFYFGSDLPYALGWLILALAGPHPVLSLDGQIRRWRTMRSSRQADNQSVVVEEQTPAGRRRFITVAGATLAAGVATGIAWANAGESKPASANGANQPEQVASQNIPATTPKNTPLAPTLSGTPIPTPAQSPITRSPTPATESANGAKGASAQGKVIAAISSLPAGSAVKFQTPDTGDNAILIHEPNGTLKAFSSICTHQGCEVSYSKPANMIICPCHGSQFDPQTGEVVRSPARRALKSYPVQTDSAGNIIYITGSANNS